MRNRSEDITATTEGEKSWHQERVIFEATERLWELLEETEMTRSELAEKLGKTRGYVTQLLSGQANMTLRTLSDLFHAFNRAIHIQDAPLTTTMDGPVVLKLHEQPTWGKDRSQANRPSNVSVLVEQGMSQHG